MTRRICALMCMLCVCMQCAVGACAAAPAPTQTPERTYTVLADREPDMLYEGETLRIAVYEEHIQMRGQRVAYFVVDVQVSDPAQLRTGFAGDAFSSGIREDTESIAARNGAEIAINADNYHLSGGKGILIRNGEFYRERASTRDMMYIDAAGDMHIILLDERAKAKDKPALSSEDLLAVDAVQTFEFGPALIRDSQALTLPKKYFISTNESIREPRTAIGQVGPLHYVLLVADGRRKDWSDKGMKLYEMQDILLQYGCHTAYNLDGGGSTTLYYGGEVINRPAGGGQRRVNDIIYFVP